MRLRMGTGWEWSQSEITTRFSQNDTYYNWRIEARIRKRNLKLDAGNSDKFLIRNSQFQFQLQVSIFMLPEREFLL